MSADQDYVKLKRLLQKFVELDSSPERVRSAIFYVYVESELKHERLGQNYQESKVMREMRLRYKRGIGQVGEPTKMYDYFYHKFLDDIKEERERVTGHPYIKWQRYK